MFHRLIIAGIVFFWLLMNGSLIRLWINPVNSEILTLPVEHVVKQMFLHEQASNLVVFQGGKRVGGLTLQPRRFDENGICFVDFTGNLLLELPFMSQQPFSWRGTVELDQSFTMHRLKLHVDARAPKITTDFDLAPKQKVASYRVQQDDEEPVESTLTLDENGARSALEALGLDPSLLVQVVLSAKSASSGGSGPTVSARQSQIEIHGERVQAFHLTVRQSDSPMVEADVSQLGQILSVKTAFGFNFSPDE